MPQLAINFSLSTIPTPTRFPPDRLSQVIDPSGDTISYVYLASGQISYMVDSTGTVSRQFAYDSIGRKVAEQSYQDTYTTYDYGYDAFTNSFGNCTTVTTQDLTGSSPTTIVVTYWDTNFNAVTIKELVDQAAFAHRHQHHLDHLQRHCFSESLPGDLKCWLPI